jgi:acyl carrier protein phosphodiesterase
MNYLAHILLARQSDAAMIGAMLGDFVKANDVRNYPAEIALEITLHRNIDSYTDSHPLFRSSVQLFGEGRRRYAGIVLDVLYDHLLSQRWDNFCDIHRPEFIQRFYRALLAHQEMLPEKLRLIAPRIVQQDWLGSYAELEGVERAVTRISQRLSRNGELLREGLADVRVHYAAMAEGFEEFFPQLERYAAERRSALKAEAVSHFVPDPK